MNPDPSEFITPPPRVSVITVVRNAPEAVAATMRSVAAQANVFEHLVIDGASSDTTMNRIVELAGPRCRVISESDHGIYDAMNKGLRMARGDWLIFMNAGDCFYNDEVVREAALHMGRDCDVLLGETITVFRDSLGTRRLHSVPKAANKWWQGMPACHQSIFYRRIVLAEFPFNLGYKWCADFEQFGRLLEAGARVKTTRKVICVFDGNGADERDIWLYIKERYRASKRMATAVARLRFFGFESAVVVFWSPVVNLIKLVLPEATQRWVREVRGTAGTKRL